MNDLIITPKLTRNFKKQARGTFIYSEIKLLVDTEFYPNIFIHKKNGRNDNDFTISSFNRDNQGNIGSLGMPINNSYTNKSNDLNSYLESQDFKNSSLIEKIDQKKFCDSLLFSTIRQFFSKIHFTENSIPFTVMWQRERSKVFEDVAQLSQNSDSGSSILHNRQNQSKVFSSKTIEDSIQKTLINKYIFLRLQGKKFIDMYSKNNIDEFFDHLVTGLKEMKCEILFFALECLERSINDFHRKCILKASKDQSTLEEIHVEIPFDEAQIKDYLCKKQWLIWKKYSITIILQYPRSEKDTGQYLFSVTKSVAMEDYYDPRGEIDVKSQKKFKHKVGELSEAWLAFLIEIPEVSEDQAIAIRQKYPTFKSLANIYFNPKIDVERKKSLLCDIQTQGRKRVGPRVSLAIYKYFTQGQKYVVTKENVSDEDQTPIHFPNGKTQKNNTVIHRNLMNLDLNSDEFYSQTHELNKEVILGKRKRDDIEEASPSFIGSIDPSQVHGILINDTSSDDDIVLLQ